MTTNQAFRFLIAMALWVFTPEQSAAVIIAILDEVQASSFNPMPIISEEQ